ncbi:MAG: glutamine--fructose-6-phosphate transaminase (isomerizing) [Candidatus Hydrogenedentes bacterium]|nr:glutamine--fructose-6-phosphate transaminase (isomerizing) [Candidatus Hydrogenedentota bacterium]
MCGIVGYIGEKNAVDVILDGLHRLEYRGYDSAGVSVLRNGALDSVRSVGKLAALEAKLEANSLSGSVGIGHTRWATHGVPSEANAHPQHDDPHAIAVVHNGIIENYLELGAELREKGFVFRSETDTETLAHLIRLYFEGDLFAAVKRALQDVRGAYAIGVVCSDDPEVLVAARSGSPLVVGLGEGESFIASDATAILNYTREVLYLEDGQVCEIRRDGYTVHDLRGAPQRPEVQTLDWDQSQAEKGGYPHFMLKEIHEQPEVVRNTIGGRISEDRSEVVWEDGLLDASLLETCERIMIVACGTAWHAGLVGKRLIESLAKVPVEIDIASEFRYRELLIPPNTIVIPITQSGETADTLQALRVAKDRGAAILSLVNAVGSTIARESDAVIYLRAGLEIGVASTKAYTAMLAALVLLAVDLGRRRGALSEEDANALLTELQQVPAKIQEILDKQGTILQCAADDRFRDAHSALFLGRGYNLPTALEGALKLKEISYIHAEAYGAGEMKHGAIALVTDKLPVIFVAPRSGTHEKIISNIQEVRARSGIILAIATEGDTGIAQHCDEVIYIPDCSEPLSPILAAVPLQLLAYYISVNRGCDVDQPRNLAKSVTVE